MAKQEYLKPQQKKEYEEQIRKCDDFLKSKNSSPMDAIRSMDPQPIIARKKEAERILAERSAPHVQGVQKDKIYQEYKEVKGELREILMKKNSLTPTDGYGNIDWGKAREEGQRLADQMEHGEMDSKVRRFRNLARMLEPNDSRMADVERLRRR